MMAEDKKAMNYPEHINEESPQMGSCDEIRTTIVGILDDQLNTDTEKIVEEADIQSDLGADSLDIVEVVMAFEEEFKVHIPDEQASELKTVGQVISFVCGLYGLEYDRELPAKTE